MADPITGGSKLWGAAPEASKKKGNRSKTQKEKDREGRKKDRKK